MTNVTFITGNPEKAANFARHIGMDIAHHSADLDEIQTIDHQELVEHKVRQAYQQLQRPVLVEDVFFTYEVLGTLPGPFVKFFVTANEGLEKMCRMLDGFTNRHATASCMFGYFDGTTLKLFEGRLGGEVVKHPRGSGGYGFDRLFAPDGFGGKTAAELSQNDYDRYYSHIKPFAEVREYLEKGIK